MSDVFYPELSDDALFALRILSENPESLRSDECPYPSDIVAFLAPDGLSITGDEPVEDVDLYEEAQRLFVELKEAKDDFTDDDHAERMSYFRTSTSLLEKLIAYKERALNIRQVSTFYRTVIDAMEEYLEPGEITELRNRMAEFDA